MTKADIIALAERVEKLSGPDREVDGAIALAMGWTYVKMKGDRQPYYRKPGATAFYDRSECPRYTKFIDAAMTLVPEGWLWAAATRPKDVIAGCQKLDPHCATEAIAATPALALTSASLRALAETRE